jgi:hypothetical protein
MARHVAGLVTPAYANLGWVACSNVYRARLSVAQAVQVTARAGAGLSLTQAQDLVSAALPTLCPDGTIPSR